MTSCDRSDRYRIYSTVHVHVHTESTVLRVNPLIRLNGIGFWESYIEHTKTITGNSKGTKMANISVEDCVSVFTNA